MDKITYDQIYLGDCLEIMPLIDTESIDMILCDLPYGVTSRNKWDVIIPFEALWKEYKRIIKRDGAIVLTATQPFASQLILSNPKMFRYDLIWEKPMPTGFLNANRMPLRSHESILVFYKQLPTYNPQKTDGEAYTITRRCDSSNYGEVKNLHYTSVSDGKRYPKSIIRVSHDKEKLHPTQKPIQLFKWLISTYTNAGDVILDSCAGSGTSGVAALSLGRHFICIEKEEEFFNLAVKRLNEFSFNYKLNI